MSSEQATIVTALATIIQIITTIVIAAITIRLTRQQNKSISVQINLNLYEKRFKIYSSLEVLINSILRISLPKEGDLEVQRFTLQISDYLQTFRKDSGERIFLIDDELNEYINSIENKIKEFSTKVSNTLPPSSRSEYIHWYDRLTKEKNEFFPLLDEVPQKFKNCLDFKKINNITN